MLDTVIGFILNTVLALAILIIGRFIARHVSARVGSAVEKSNDDVTLGKFVASLTYVALMAFIIIAAMGQLGIETASLVAILAAAGLAIGLALQGSLANFASGVMLIIFRPLKVGDFVEAGGATGTVREIGIFTSILSSPDNKKIYVPNANLTGANIINYSAFGTRRIDLVAGVSYGDSLDLVKATLEQILAEDDRILTDPAPTIAVLELADSSVNFAVRPWVKEEDYWDVRFDTQEKIKQRFDEKGISIPFPQQDVHLIKAG
ncbi:MAG: mechanosensitive ion channel protein [Gammaproteobacteria bacterium]|jgi:small conductance mechanosensitive channel|nr:mechanosensitive ion channel protein [Gammaproteobacteria bacterium]RPG24091.1 MAG: mechanosensitive ion channel family protein [Gammaproteobacteria bacterium TMED57]|tara:strand:+ start:152 stop:940 length:789 start_codon:yes stop_codon:yes gene_type:complete